MGKKSHKKIFIDSQQVTTESLRRNFTRYAIATEPTLTLTAFHRTYYQLLGLFAKGVIRRLIVSVPPQHGKSLGASRLLPAYLLGLDPNLRIAIGSYSFALARKFGQGIQQVMESPAYLEIFPNTRLKGSGERTTAIRTAEEFDCVGYRGGVKLVGRECSLTGNRVDIMILDDLYKDAQEANSPTIRDNTWDWYTSVVRTRMHNDSQELIVFTRWHEDDLIGRLLQSERVVDLTDIDYLDSADRDERAWVRVNFPALKVGAPTALDPREPGEALWRDRHNERSLSERRALDDYVFEALYQGHPATAAGMLYGRFSVYDELPREVLRRCNYTDTADTGDDFLCSVNYSVGADGHYYVTDLVYTDLPMEQTERMVAELLERGRVEVCQIESNNGGRGFARAVKRLLNGRWSPAIRTVHQGSSKESRVLSNATAVNQHIVMPRGWESRFAEFYTDLTQFRRRFRDNAHDDAPDVLTGIIETETAAAGRIRSVHFN